MFWNHVKVELCVDIWNMQRTRSFMSFPGDSAVNNLPAMQETWVQSVGQEDTLENDIATHSNTLAWEIPWTEEPGGLQSMGF